MHLILTGATGLVGSAVLHHMINTPSVTAVSILSRRPVPQADGHGKVKVIIHKDFNTYPSDVLERLQGAEGCVWAQGISITKVTKEEYQKITYDYPLAAARAFATLPEPGIPFKFVYVSGEGATTSPGIFTAHFGLIKGRAEAALLALSKDPQFRNLRPFSLRPAGIDTAFHPEIRDWIPQRNGMEMLVQTGLLPILRYTWGGMISPTRDLARILTELASSDGAALEGKGIEGEGRIINNVGMRRLAGI
ncbi:hypothetical protein VE00_07924 [Pseudogymnoascus sp. WSF 3629]|nr:hypothetical protein VE00_07924 [Pseudogymnoascus sp. WSF 3629]